MADVTDMEDNKNTTLMKRILLIIVFITSIFTYLKINETVTRFDLPNGDIKWSDVKPENARMCIPAAFTDEDGKISGAYRQEGKRPARTARR